MIMPTMGNRKTKTHQRSLCETGRLDLRTSTVIHVSVQFKDIGTRIRQLVYGSGARASWG
jgi:hypothetical protein